MHKNSTFSIGLEPVFNTRRSEESTHESNKCLLCEWTFPHSFRIEEKNVHLNRCIENKGTDDSGFWAQCSGNLKKYLFGFSEYLEKELVPSTNRRRRDRKPEKKRVKKDKEASSASRSKEKKSDLSLKYIRKTSKKENGKRLKPKDKKVSATIRIKKEELVELKQEIEPQIIKKMKKEEVVQAKKDGTKNDFTKIIYLPLVTQLIFDPSKEFRKGNRRRTPEK